jgi:hypothetical protein
MEKFVAVVETMGGLTVLGGLIDLAMWKSEKEKLRSRLEDWWLRFMDVKWSNFGRKEAELAIRILDRWAGPDMFSRKRWQFALTVVTFALVLVLAWSSLRALWSPTSFALTAQPGMIAFAVVILFSANVIGFVFSLSLTRFVAKWVAWLSRGAVLTMAAFCLLLAIHVALLVYWSVAVYGLQVFVMMMYIVVYLVVSVGPDELAKMANQPIPDEFLSPLASIFRDFLGGEADSTGFPEPRAPTWAVLFSWHNPPDVPFASVVTHGVKVLMDFVANGLRILFALVFLSSFVFRPLIQEPVSRLWYGAMNSGKPFFTMLFGAIGTVVGLAQLVFRMT